MHDGLELLKPFGMANQMPRELFAIDDAIHRDAGEGGLDRRDGGASIELVHRLVGGKGRDPEISESLEGGGLARGNRTGEPELQHQSVASILARSAGVTSGRTPNQASKPGTA